MSKYQRYGKELDRLARERFSSYEKARERYEKARKVKSDNPYPTGWGATPEAQIKAKKAEIEYIEAENAFKDAQRVYQGTLSEVEKLRKELYDEIQNDMTASPADLDRNVVDLLASGICSAREIRKMYEDSHDVTTRRYIAKYAKERDVKKLSDEDRVILNGVVYDGDTLTDPESSSTMKDFDALSDVLGRCVNNPAMIGCWGQLTEEVISEM